MSDRTPERDLRDVDAMERFLDDGVDEPPTKDLRKQPDEDVTPDKATVGDRIAALQSRLKRAKQKRAAKKQAKTKRKQLERARSGGSAVLSGARSVGSAVAGASGGLESERVGTDSDAQEVFRRAEQTAQAAPIMGGDLDPSSSPETLSTLATGGGSRAAVDTLATGSGGPGVDSLATGNAGTGGMDELATAGMGVDATGGTAGANQSEARVDDLVLGSGDDADDGDWLGVGGGDLL